MQNQPKTHRIRVLVLLLVWLGFLGVLYANQQRVVDWWKLRGYTPSSDVTAIAQATKMNELGTHLFYVNRPQLMEAATFSKECPIAAEKTIILGCYKGGDNGIYLYSVSDVRLQGVEEVTAAHEMLHAAYARLSANEKKQLNKQLEDFFETLTDDRIKQTIASYRQTEPTELANEMHSIFATEILELPSSLEKHYARYFSSRKAVARLAARYQSEFTSRRERIAGYDAELAGLKQQIDKNQSILTSQRADLDTQQSQLDALRKSDAAAYNGLVSSYNRLVRVYNSLLEQTREDITRYNDIVEARNAIALEERQLTQALSAEGLPAAQ
ncbi:MAG: hypothetical protein WAW63_02100 [Candidatus Saccharimonadales bacterium]